MSLIYINPYSFAATDPNFADVSLLLHGDGANNSTTFTDSSSNNFTVSGVGDVKISTTQSKFGGSSIFFDGTGDYLTLSNNSDFNFSNDFTVEAWVFPTAIVSKFDAIFTIKWTGEWNSGGPGLVLCVGTVVSTHLGLTVISDYTGGNIATNSWTHLAVSRAGSTMKAFKNGSEVASLTNSSNLGTSNVPGIGIFDTLNGSARLMLTGYIDELRVTKGVARYTAAFTPPAAPFPDA